MLTKAVYLNVLCKYYVCYEWLQSQGKLFVRSFGGEKSLKPFWTEMFHFNVNQEEVI